MYPPRDYEELFIERRQAEQEVKNPLHPEEQACVEEFKKLLDEHDQKPLTAAEYRLWIPMMDVIVKTWELVKSASLQRGRIDLADIDFMNSVVEKVRSRTLDSRVSLEVLLDRTRKLYKLYRADCTLNQLLK